MAPNPAKSAPGRPDWNFLYETAAGQEGLFSTQQAAQAGFSPQLLAHHIHAGRVRRVRRGVYRVVHFPAGEHEELVAVWLWSERAGVFSHETALALHALSDVLPARTHLTVPEGWSKRRLRVPKGAVLHYADIPAKQRSWMGPIPITSVARTLNDLAASNLSPELLRAAAEQALHRGLIARKQIADVEAAVAPFGGLDA